MTCVHVYMWEITSRRIFRALHYRIRGRKHEKSIYACFCCLLMFFKFSGHHVLLLSHGQKWLKLKICAKDARRSAIPTTDRLWGVRVSVEGRCTWDVWTEVRHPRIWGEMCSLICTAETAIHCTRRRLWGRSWHGWRWLCWRCTTWGKSPAESAGKDTSTGNPTFAALSRGTGIIWWGCKFKVNEKGIYNLNNIASSFDKT